ncbi:MAG: glycosyltransferase family 2 protein [Gallionella sp.]|nr:glycosyltransferase family 2 protein [Gallionella sp.]
MPNTDILVAIRLANHHFVLNLIMENVSMSASKMAIMPHLSVVVPVYKAENCLDELYLRLKSALEVISPNFEIVLVEDCGGDNSWQVIERLAAADSRVRGLQFSRNFGQHYGITAGLDCCRGDWVVVMDCDLQDRPEEIPRLYAKAQEGFDVVLARRGKRCDPPLKRVTSWLYYKVFSYLADVEYDGESGNFRIMSRKVVQNFRRMGEQLRFFGGLVQWMGFPTASVEVEHAGRFEGKSTYTYAKLWKLASETIIAHSDKPLRLAVRFGFLMALFSFLYGAYILARALFYSSPIPGWSSMIVSLYFIGGVIIGILGILGIYLGKTFDESKKRPLYIIRRETGDEFGGTV